MMDKLRGFLLHICVICSCACMIAEGLDWYNPYMDFSGHVFWVRNILYVSIVILSVTRTYKPLRQKMSEKEKPIPYDFNGSLYI